MFLCVCVSIIEYYKCIIGQTPKTTTGWTFLKLFLYQISIINNHKSDWNKEQMNTVYAADFYIRIILEFIIILR